MDGTILAPAPAPALHPDGLPLSALVVGQLGRLEAMTQHKIRDLQEHRLAEHFAAEISLWQQELARTRDILRRFSAADTRCLNASGAAA